MPAALALGFGLTLACRADVGERCVCSDDCKSGLVCVSGGRVLREDECVPATADDPGECVEDADSAGADDDAGGGPTLYMDLGSKRDFDPGLPPQTDSGSGDATDTGVTDTGVTDTGVTDTGVTDTGLTDTGLTDTTAASTDSTGATDSTGTSATGTTGTSTTGTTGTSSSTG